MSKIEVYYPQHEDFSVFEHTQINGIKESVPREHLFAGVVVWSGNIAAAKAALYINPHLHYQSFSPAVVGAYQASDDLDAIRLLFDMVERIACEQGKDYLIGPMNGSTWENYRFHDHPAIPLFFMEMKHKAYYPEQWKTIGFQPIARYLSAIAPIVPQQNDKIEQVKKRLLYDGVTIRSIDMGNYEADLKKLYPFLHESFKQNFLYTPISESSFLAKYLPLQSVLKSEFVQIAEHEGEIIGVLLGVDDLLNPENKTLIIKTLARNPQRLYRGLGLLLVDAFYQLGVTEGYQHIIFAFMIEEGDATPLSGLYNGHTLKNYTLYGKSI